VDEAAACVMAATKIRVNSVFCISYIHCYYIECEVLVGPSVAERPGCSVSLHGAADPRSQYKHDELIFVGVPLLELLVLFTNRGMRFGLSSRFKSGIVMFLID